MALPLVIFAILMLVGIAFFVIGVFGSANERGIGFVPLAGIVFLLTGALVWSSGLELNQVSGFDTSTETIGVNYTTVTVSDGSPLWLVANAIFWGGVIVLLMGFGKIMELRTARNYDADYDV